MDPKTILIGNDHGGLRPGAPGPGLPEQKGIPAEHAGCNSAEVVGYPRYAARVVGAISRGEIERGILICSTGIGLSIIANKFKAVRASLCTSTYMGEMTRAHNNSNCLCLGGRITGAFEARDILGAWLTTAYDGGRHDISLGRIAEAENTLCHPGGWTPSPAHS